MHKQKLSSVQRRKSKILTEAGFLPYNAGTGSAADSKQMVTADAIPAGAIDQAGELGGLDSDDGSSVSDQESSRMIKQEVFDIKQSAAALEVISLDLRSLLNGALGNETEKLTKVAVLLTKISDKIDSKLAAELVKGKTS